MHEHARDWPVGVEGRDYVVARPSQEAIDRFLSAPVEPGQLILCGPAYTLWEMYHCRQHFEHGAGI